MQRAWRLGCVTAFALWASGCAISANDSARGGGPPWDAGAEGAFGGTGGAGGAGDFADAGAALNEDRVVECGESSAVISCGGVACVGPDPFAAQTCEEVCCTTDDECGLRPPGGSTCVAQPTAGGCPDATLNLGAGTQMLRGCCTSTDTCGAVAFGECLPRARLDLDVMDCDELDDAGVDDAGSAP